MTGFRMIPEISDDEHPVPISGAVKVACGTSTTTILTEQGYAYVFWETYKGILGCPLSGYKERSLRVDGLAAVDAWCIWAHYPSMFVRDINGAVFRSPWFGCNERGQSSNYRAPKPSECKKSIPMVKVPELTNVDVVTGRYFMASVDHMGDFTLLANPDWLKIHNFRSPHIWNLSSGV